MKKRLFNKSIFLSVTFLSFLLIVPLFIQNVIEEKNLNTAGWSRSVDIGEAAINKSTFQRINNDSIDIYLSDSKSSIKKVEIDPLTLNVINEKKIKVPSNPYYTYWVSADDENIIYFSGENLYRFGSGKNEIIAEKVDELTVNNDTIIFRSGEVVYTLNPTDFSKTKVLSDDNILKIIVDPYSPSFISLHQYGEIGGVEFNYHKWNGHKYDSTSVYVKDSFTQPVTNIDFKEWDKNLLLIYETTAISGGAKDTSHHYLELPLNMTNHEPVETKLKIYDENNIEISSVLEIQLQNSKKEASVIFRGNGELKKSVQNRNLYLASLNNGKWSAARISTNYDPVVEPLLTGDDYLTWLIHDGTNYKLVAANTSPQVIIDSKSSTIEDWIRALEDTLFGLTSALVMLLFFILLVIPAIIVIFLAKFFDVKKTKLAEITANVLFALCSYALLNKLMNEKFLLIAPEYISFQGSIWVILVAVIGVSYILTNLTKNQDWEFEMNVIYFVGVSIWAFSLLIGPYII
ncbi:hypothetical protein [Bacillus suaedaesalsae]|uniref:DUF5050 domain-containing protein n=1 Tax=Bacillus suaedaesalsae TaxID=2810349 RepID=A0ABS2DFL8_9BACI|nr:hypothetical protein [Bacillus suaedaesalsae]MBM6617272.1 hypothetical protein [Bacillus suaedaesalsae]